MNRERSERKIERMLSEGEPAEPLEGLLERLRADIPPLDKIGAAHLRTALDQRRVRRLPVLWMTAASAAFLMVGGSLAFRLWQSESTLGRERRANPAAESAFEDRLTQKAAPGSAAPFSRLASPSPTFPPPPPAVSPVAIPEGIPVPADSSEPVSPGVPGGVVGGLAKPGPEPSQDAAAGAGRDVDEERESQERAPAARDPWKTLAVQPGVRLDRIHAGGKESGQQSVYLPAEAPDGKGGSAAPAPPPAAPSPGRPPALADERRLSASRVAEGARRERQQAPMASSRGMNSSTPAAPEPFAELDQAALVPQDAEDVPLRIRGREGVRFEAALLPWHRSVSSRTVIGVVPGSAEKKTESQESGSGGWSKAKPPQKAAPEAQGEAMPALAIRFEPTAVVRARWLGEEEWRVPGGWEGLAGRPAGRSSRLEVELRPGLKVEQVVAFVRFPESVRPLRLAEMTRSWDGASWELRIEALRSELAAALKSHGAGLNEQERFALLTKARAAEAARSEDPRAQELGDLIRRFEDSLDRP